MPFLEDWVVEAVDWEPSVRSGDTDAAMGDLSGSESGVGIRGVRAGVDPSCPMT
jgi:hypothetical protein